MLITINYEEILELMHSDGSIKSVELRDLVVKKFKESLVEIQKIEKQSLKKRVEKKLPQKVVKKPKKKPKIKGKSKVKTLTERAFPLFDQGVDYKEVAKQLKITPGYASALKTFWKKDRELKKGLVEEEDFSDPDEFSD